MNEQMLNSSSHSEAQDFYSITEIDYLSLSLFLNINKNVDIGVYGCSPMTQENNSMLE